MSLSVDIWLVLDSSLGSSSSLDFGFGLDLFTAGSNYGVGSIVDVIWG